MTDGLEVRPATPLDEPALLRLQLELRDHHRFLEPENPRYAVEREEWQRLLRESLQRDDRRFLVATLGGSVCGFIQLSFVSKPWGMSCEMGTLAVSESQRSSGLGSTLVEAAEDLAREVGARGIRANVLVANGRGRAFYERLGYEAMAVRYAKSL